MGDWYVQYGIPAVGLLENGGHNGRERYHWDESTQRVSVTYTFNEKSFSGRVNESTQIGRVVASNPKYFCPALKSALNDAQIRSQQRSLTGC